MMPQLHQLPTRSSPQQMLCVHPAWKDYLHKGWAADIFEWDTPDQLHEKQGRSIARCQLAGTSIFLKRHYVLPRLNGLLARLIPWRAWSPGLHEWENIQRAERAGVPVPVAVAAGECRGPGLRLQSFLAVQELTGFLPLHEAIPLAHQQLSPREFQRWKRGLITELARITRQMHQAGFYHRDLYLCHFYIRESDIQHDPSSWRGRVIAIDFHRFGKTRGLPILARAKDLAQFLFSSMDVSGVTTRDRVRFWRAYVGEQKNNNGGLQWLTLWKTRRYARHNARHVLTVPRKEPK